MSDLTVFEGEFAKGGPGVTTMPISLQGRGSIEVRPDGGADELAADIAAGIGQAPRERP
jgi:hypothetical protein